VTALDAKWHEACFVCSHCSAPFGENPCFQHEGKPYCQADFLELFSRKCAKCNQGILPGESVTVFKKDWHATCLVCAYVDSGNELPWVVCQAASRDECVLAC